LVTVAPVPSDNTLVASFVLGFAAGNVRVGLVPYVPLTVGKTAGPGFAEELDEALGDALDVELADGLALAEPLELELPQAASRLARTPSTATEAAARRRGESKGTSILSSVTAPAWRHGGRKRRSPGGEQ
jgi:hypothetical protein